MAGRDTLAFSRNVTYPTRTGRWIAHRRHGKDEVPDVGSSRNPDAQSIETSLYGILQYIHLWVSDHCQKYEPMGTDTDPFTVLYSPSWNPRYPFASKTCMGSVLYRSGLYT